jgi:short-chain Z-isoprenyl diphosphate synthase
LHIVREVLYRLYERRLAQQLAGAALPRHVALILDGNRRFARLKGLPDVSEGHRLGASRIHDVLEWCDELGIAHVTLWMLSTDNLAREDEEVRQLVEIIGETVGRIARTHPDVRITTLGALDTLPDDLQYALKEAVASTCEHRGLHVQVAVGYGGREEITDALRSLLLSHLAEGHDLAEVIDRLSPEAISAHLYTNGTPDPDLIIRTSGEIRLSGFLLWQSVHSEFHFCDAYWPEFRRTDFLRALRDFASRQRRYGR